jgi:methyltransferase (TIGR00027 family)
MPIRNVSDTALWVAIYRAQESERADAHFHDPHARRMAGARGQDIVRTLPLGQSMAWSMVVRTAVMDEVILRCIARGARTVLNLGAGLDTRPFRLALPGTLRWIDVDLPDMVSYRRDCLGAETANCIHSHVACDLGDAAAVRDVLASAGGSHDSMLVVTEGLLLYFAPDDVAALARQLHADRRARWWLTDLITPWLSKTMGSSWSSHLSPAGAPFRFAPAHSARFFEPLGWREAEFHSTWDCSLRLQRPAPLAWMWNAFGQRALPRAHERVRRMSGIALLDRIDVTKPIASG